jgi:hypothetical protein
MQAELCCEGRQERRRGSLSTAIISSDWYAASARTIAVEGTNCLFGFFALGFLIPLKIFYDSRVCECTELAKATCL